MTTQHDERTSAASDGTGAHPMTTSLVLGRTQHPSRGERALLLAIIAVILMLVAGGSGSITLGILAGVAVLASLGVAMTGRSDDVRVRMPA